MLRPGRLPHSFNTRFKCFLLVSWRSASSFPSSSIGRRCTKSITNPQGLSLKFESRRSVCYVAFAAGVSHGAWRSPLCARFHTFPRNFPICSMALRWTCLALARLWVCLVRSFIHFSNAKINKYIKNIFASKASPMQRGAHQGISQGKTSARAGQLAG